MDILKPVLNKMSIGRATKQGAQEAGEAAINSQDLCFAAVNAYFSHTLPYDDDETVVNYLQQLITDASVINEGTIAQLRAARTGRRLHRLCCFSGQDPRSRGRFVPPFQVSDILV